MRLDVLLSVGIRFDLRLHQGGGQLVELLGQLLRLLVSEGLSVGVDGLGVLSLHFLALANERIFVLFVTFQALCGDLLLHRDYAKVVKDNVFNVGRNLD